MCSCASLPAIGLDDDEIRMLVEALKGNTCMKRLDLGNNLIAAPGAIALAAVLKTNPTIVEFSLFGNRVRSDAADGLATLLKHNTTLRLLHLGDNAIGDAGAVKLAKALQEGNNTLRELVLFNNRLGDQAAISLAKMLEHNSALTQLNLQHNSITAEGGKALGRVLDSNRALKRLDLKNNSLACARGFGDTLPLDRELETDWSTDDEGMSAFNAAQRKKREHQLLADNKQVAVEHTTSDAVMIVPHQETSRCDPLNSMPLWNAHVNGKQGIDELKRIMNRLAAHSDTQMAGRAKLMLVGEGRAGKTTTLRSLMGKEFNMQEHSTLGADSMDLSVIVESMDVCNWQHLTSGLSEYMRTLLGTALARATKMDAAMKEAVTAAMKEHQRRIEEQHQLVEDGDDDDDDRQASMSTETQPTSVSTQYDAYNSSSSSSPKLPKQSQQHQQSASAAISASMSRPSVSTEDIEKAIKEFNVDAVMGEGKARVTFKVFDLGGQSTFYIFHPFFLTEYAVYLLVFSMEDLLYQDESKRAETWEFMEHWLSSLHLHAKGAPVLIVGTFADKISERKQHEVISCGIYSRLRHNPAFPGVVHNDKHGLWFWPVDNTKSINDPMIQDLRQTISSTALAQEYVSQEVAVPYLHLYDKLNAIARDEKRPLLTFGEVAELARTCGLRTRDETRACLQFLHLYSMVLYYDSVPGMEDYVILSPQWAVDMMTRVIRNFDLHHDVRDGEARAVGAHLWDDLVDRGILHRRLLDVLWNDVHSNLVVPFLRLMMQYGLCVEYSPPKLVDSRRALTRPNSGHRDGDDGSEGVDTRAREQQYLVPAILPMTIRHSSTMESVTLSTTAAQQANPYFGYEVKTAYVAFSLKQFKRSASVCVDDAQHASFLPEGLFTVVLAHVMAHAQHGASQEPKLSRTHAICFMESTKLELQLVPAVGGIKMKITSAQPRAMLQTVHMLHKVISEAARERYPELKSSLLLPYDDKTLLFFEDVLHHHKSKQGMWVDEQLLSPDDLVKKYGPLIPVLGLQDKYDVFISYRQRASSGLVMALHPRLEQRNLVAFLDANNLETGVNFKHAFMTAIGLSLVACPIVSAATIAQMRQLQHSDYCDNVLLEWMAMLAMREFKFANHHLIRLQRVAPVIVDSAWHDVEVSSSTSRAEANEYDSFDSMKRLATTLPDVVSKKTAAALDQYFTQVLRLPRPQRHKTVREVVLSLFDIEGAWRCSAQASGQGTTAVTSMAQHIRDVVDSLKDNEESLDHGRWNFSPHLLAELAPNTHQLSKRRWTHIAPLNIHRHASIINDLVAEAGGHVAAASDVLKQLAAVAITWNPQSLSAFMNTIEATRGRYRGNLTDPRHKFAPRYLHDVHQNGRAIDEEERAVLARVTANTYYNVLDPGLLDQDPPVRLQRVFHGVMSFEAVVGILAGDFVQLKSTDDGWYGAGIYFTPDIEYALAFTEVCRGHNVPNDLSVLNLNPNASYRVVLACDVVYGNPYPVLNGKCKGQPLKIGHDAHVAVVDFSSGDFRKAGPFASHRLWRIASKPPVAEIVVANGVSSRVRAVLVFEASASGSATQDRGAPASSSSSSSSAASPPSTRAAEVEVLYVRRAEAQALNINTDDDDADDDDDDDDSGQSSARSSPHPEPQQSGTQGNSNEARPPSGETTMSSSSTASQELPALPAASSSSSSSHVSAQPSSSTAAMTGEMLHCDLGPGSVHFVSSVVQAVETDDDDDDDADGC
ncbi:hypothetical protein PTSG_11903 [Salpingoeca rosetta]|uniref:non-specific serine/threonine protein kinase n=1 Tax=Salpingoeca rosetta (strain ATCC 50818 / BSB-021) TaxID=946362 RepID=F2U2Y6_SALR5|nr:uncharacterized protein PTSG_11903 [Salpingoeca rosetta]EGD81980.1 hypothetical protein PTSG_11903 [Salpingoeca rosetta]|eukprot:XP_004996163.1 hypothetical protein PTSG_11903 [Salpingoeca rosetta]